jgi:cytochrome c oxidase cbb3-type subunit 1
MAVAFWLLARLGRTRLAAPAFAFAGAIIWNIGVTVGSYGILAGDLTGFDWFSFPRYAAPILFFAYLAIGLSAGITFAARREFSTYVSQWFILAALFVFPWIYATANLLLIFHPVRGVLQVLVNSWFSSNLLLLWLTPIALATIFYFVSKLKGRLLYSHYLAVSGFWMWILVAGWCGIPFNAPLPAWISAVSTVASVLLLVAVLALAINWRITATGGTVESGSLLSYKFIRFAGLSFILFAIAFALMSFPQITGTLGLTFASVAVSQLGLYAFFAMAIFGAIYYIVPLVTGGTWKSGMAKLQFGLSAAGIILSVIGLGAGGIIQGNIQKNSSAEFIQSVKATAPMIGINTLGVMLLLIAHLLLLMNFFSVLRRAFCACSVSQPVENNRRTRK